MGWGIKCLAHTLLYSIHISNLKEDPDWPCLGHVSIHEPVTTARELQHQFWVMYSPLGGVLVRKALLELIDLILHKKKRIYYRSLLVNSKRLQTKDPVDFAATYSAH